MFGIHMYAQITLQTTVRKVTVVRYVVCAEAHSIIPFFCIATIQNSVEIIE